jgi:hypothetical protein
MPKNPEFALFLGEDYLLCFGNDIMISNGCNEEESSSSKFPSDYACNAEVPSNQRASYLAGAPLFQVDDIEVY